MHACRARVEAAHSCARLLQQLVGPFLLRRRKMDHMHHMKLPLKREEVGHVCVEPSFSCTGMHVSTWRWAGNRLIMIGAILFLR